MSVHPFDLDPTFVAKRTYASRRRRRHLIDICALINILLFLLFLVPSRLVVPQLTAVGRPALLFGVLLGLVWALSKLHPRLAMRGPQPIRWVAVAYLVTFLMSYAAGFLRGLRPLEANSADRALIETAIFLGIALACADGIPNRSRLDDVVRMLVWCAAGMALVGLLQFALDFDVTTLVTIPGLTLHADLQGLEARGDGFFRVASTATHYIEFSTVMAVCLPFAIHVARFGGTRAMRQCAIVAALLIAVAIPVTLSRTGILGLIVGAVAMLPAWPARARFNIGAIGIAVVVAIMVVRPGLLGTIRSLFFNMSGDPSIQGRTEDYDIVYRFIAERPLLGRGQGTFIPKLYLILDNQWLQQLIGGGIAGTVALAAMHIAAIALAALALRRSTEAADRHLCACLIAAQLIAVVVHGTFDSFAFSTFTALLALLIGASGAMWRLTHPTRQIRNVGHQGLTE